MSSRCNYVFDAYVVDGFVRSIAFLNIIIIIIICEIITYFPGIYPRFTSRLLLHNPMKYGTENNDETKRSRLGGEEWWPPLRIKHHHFMCTQAHTPLAPGTRWTCYVETSPDSTSRFARTQPWTNEPLIRERRISCERRRNAFLEDKKTKKQCFFTFFFIILRSAWRHWKFGLGRVNWRPTKIWQGQKNINSQNHEEYNIPDPN